MIQERILCVLVGCLIISTSLVFVTVYFYPSEDGEQTLWILTQAVGLVTLEVTIIIALVNLQYPSSIPSEDFYRYEGNICFRCWS